MNSYQKTYEELVQWFGGQQKTAKALGCTQPSVWAWINGKAKMSAKLAVKAERLTDRAFLKESLCPALSNLESI